MVAVGKSSARKRTRAEKLATAILTCLLLLHFGVSIATYMRVVSQQTSFRPGDTFLSHEAVKSKIMANHDHIDLEAIERLQHTFPIHVNEWTELPHPGVQGREFLFKNSQDTANRLENWPSDLPTIMRVPQFFDESHGAAYGGSIRSFLGDNGNHLITPEEARMIGSRILGDDGRSLETIYCSIASYRDYECTATVIDVLARAQHPERIRISIIDQRLPGDPVCAQPETPCAQNPDQTLCRYQHLLDRTEIDARLACGPVFARHLAHRQYRGEFFAMQIDAHVRFTKHWDTDLIQMWSSAKNEMAVISFYLSDVDGLDQKSHTSLKKGRAIMCQSDFEGRSARRHLRHGVQPERVAAIQEEPMVQPYWAAGFSFARGHFLIQVPYDQHLPQIFQGEEVSMGLRGFTYGYDYYTPQHTVCFHIYAVRDHKEIRNKVPKFHENSRYYSGVGLLSMKRLNTIVGMEDFPREEWNTIEETKYGLGQVRRLQTFFETFGIHVTEHRVEKHLCDFVGVPMMKEFRPALRENGMGLDYDKIQYKFVNSRED